MLNDLWRDVIAIFGLVGTIAGLAYAISQIHKTKKAAEAAKEASERTFRESKVDYLRFAAADLHRFVHEVGIYLDKEDWDKAAMRLSDVADQAAQLGSFDPDWAPLIQELRAWAALCVRLAKGERQRFDDKRWGEFFLRLSMKIYVYHGPFRDSAKESFQ